MGLMARKLAPGFWRYFRMKVLASKQIPRFPVLSVLIVLWAKEATLRKSRTGSTFKEAYGLALKAGVSEIGDPRPPSNGWFSALASKRPSGGYLGPPVEEVRVRVPFFL